MTAAETSLQREEQRSWVPMVGLFLAQILMSFNVAALPISIGGMVADFGVPPTVAGSTIVVYGLVVAALVMTGTKLGQRVGWVLIFRCVVVVFAGSSLMMILSPGVGWAIAGQALAGAAAAIIVPALVALIAENYRGDQQAAAIGSLGSARALSGDQRVPDRRHARHPGGVAAGVHDRPRAGRRGVPLQLQTPLGQGRLQHQDRSGRLLTDRSRDHAPHLGFNDLNGWGAFFASPGAPFDVLGISPAPVTIVLGIIFGQAFFTWTRRRMREGKVPLVDMSVLRSSRERAAVYAMFIVVALEAALNFTVPMYIQIVQGRTPFETSLAMMPFNLTVFITATLVVRFYKRHSPRTIGVTAFILTTAALVWLSFVVTNSWETLPTILGLIVFGIGQGALVTLVFNVLVTAAPAELAGDVGSHCGSAQNLASAMGNAVIGALLVALLSVGVGRAVMEHPELPEELVAQVDLDSVNFVSNAALEEVLSQTDATPAQVEAAVELNEEERLRALKLGLLILAGISALAILPASRLPRYKTHEIPAPDAEVADT